MEGRIEKEKSFQFGTKNKNNAVMDDKSNDGDTGIRWDDHGKWIGKMWQAQEGSEEVNVQTPKVWFIANLRCTRHRATNGIVYRVNPKNDPTCFCQNFVKSEPNLLIASTRIAKTVELCQVYSVSTSPNFMSTHYRVNRRCSKLLHRPNAELLCP